MRLANADGALTALYEADLRNRRLAVKRYDRVSGLQLLEFSGVISEAILGPGVLELIASAPNLAVFEEETPKLVVSTALFKRPPLPETQFRLRVGDTLAGSVLPALAPSGPSNGGLAVRIVDAVMGGPAVGDDGAAPIPDNSLGLCLGPRGFLCPLLHEGRCTVYADRRTKSTPRPWTRSETWAWPCRSR